MWIDESDTTQLSQRLRVGPRELLEAIGGPWQIVERFPEHEMERPGTLFVGRAGPSVGILVTDDASPGVSVGMAGGIATVVPDRMCPEWFVRLSIWSMVNHVGVVYGEP